MRTQKRHSHPVEIEKGSGLRSVKCENVGTHKRHSLSVEIDKGSGLRSVKCENVGTHKRHSIRKMAKLIRRLKKRLAVLAGLRRNF